MNSYLTLVCDNKFSTGGKFDVSDKIQISDFSVVSDLLVLNSYVNFVTTYIRIVCACLSWGPSHCNQLGDNKMPPIWFKRAYRGLYANRKIGFGNKVSHAGNKTRRSWKPNVQKATLFSETLGEKFRTQVTTHALRCIRKAGGLDEYLLKVKDSEIKNPRAIRFKERIIDARRKGLSDLTGSSNTSVPDAPKSEKPTIFSRVSTTSVSNLDIKL